MHTNNLWGSHINSYRILTVSSICFGIWLVLKCANYCHTAKKTVQICILAMTDLWPVAIVSIIVKKENDASTRNWIKLGFGEIRERFTPTKSSVPPQSYCEIESERVVSIIQQSVWAHLRRRHMQRRCFRRDLKQLKATTPVRRRRSAWTVVRRVVSRKARENMTAQFRCWTRPSIPR